MTGQYDAADEAVAVALANAFPGRNLEEISPAGPSWNDQNETVRVDFTDGETVFLKVATHGDGSRITRECAVINYVDAHCEVDVPTVLASRADGSVPYLVTAPMSGQNFHIPWSDWSIEERVAAIHQVGAALAGVNSHQFDRHGHIVGGGADELILETGSWTDILIDKIDEIWELASSDRFEHHYDEVVAAVEANRERLDSAPATLVHSDPSMPNIFHSKTTVGFIDWEIAHVGDPARELRRAQNQLIESRDWPRRERLTAALQEGYQRRAGSLPAGFEDRGPVYDAVTFLGTSGFFDKHVEGAEEPAEEFATWVEAEMNRRLNAIR